MSGTILAVTVVVLLMSRLMVGIYTGETYSCPVCGTTEREDHADDCPWGQ
jgi:hypothetical protein